MHLGWWSVLALGVLVLISAAGLALSGPITVGVPWLAREEFGVTAAAFGQMLSMWTTGSLIGVVIAGSVSSNPRWRALVTGVLAAAMVVLGLTDSQVVAAASLFVMGTAAGTFNIFLLSSLVVEHGLSNQPGRSIRHRQRNLRDAAGRR